MLIKSRGRGERYGGSGYFQNIRPKCRTGHGRSATISLLGEPPRVRSSAAVLTQKHGVRRLVVVTGFDWAVVASLIAALLAAAVSVANVIMTARLSGRRESTAWARERLPELITLFWVAASAMETEVDRLRDVEDLSSLEDPEGVGMTGFAAMVKILEKLELVAPSKVAYRAAIYMDALDEERLLLLSAKKSNETSTQDLAVDRLGPRQEFLKACRETMGLDLHSTAGRNSARARSVSVHPRIVRRHERALRRLEAAHRRGPRWWRR